MQIYTSFVKKSSKWAVEKNGVFETENVWILHIQFDLIFLSKLLIFMQLYAVLLWVKKSCNLPTFSV